jgi:ATP-dependent protease HslVU (ClpYQ) peptidase subunit
VESAITTICFCLHSRKVAHDGRVTSDGEIISDTRDKRIQKHNIDFFFAGNFCDTDEIVDAFHKRRRKIRKTIDSTALAWDGKTLWDITATAGELTWHPVASEYGAIGSGASYALVALKDGKTPRQAVITAKKSDSNTGGKVVTHKLKLRGKV